MPRLHLLPVPLLLLLAPSLGAAPATQPRLWATLLDVDQKARAIADLRADFHQEKTTPLLKHPLVSRGQIFLKGDAMVWDTLSPEPTRMRIDPRQIMLYYPRQAQLEIYPVDKKLSSLAASPLPRLQILKDYFTFSPADAAATFPGATLDGMLAIEMTPIDPALARHLQSVSVLLDLQHGFIVQAVMVDADQDRTAIRFDHIQINTHLGDDKVRLDIPAGVKVSRPLEGLGADSLPPPPKP